MATKSISQLDSATSVSASDLYEVAVPDVQSASGYASKKESGAQIANFFHEGIQNNNLNTTDKTVVGAINEVDSIAWNACVVGTSVTITTGNTWHKFATITTPYDDFYAFTGTFVVNNTVYDGNVCILHCYVRVATGGRVDAADLELIGNYGFDKNDFRIYAVTDEINETVTFELWVSVSRRYKYCRILMIDEGTRTSIDYVKVWTLRNSTSASAPPTESSTCVRYDCLPLETLKCSEVAPVENGANASQAYAIGDYMVWKGGFYKVTSAISSGGAITAGTNVTKTTIGAELKAALS